MKINKVSNFDIRVKFILIAFMNYTLLHRVSGFLEWHIFLVLFLLFIFEDKYLKSLKFFLIFLTLQLLEYYVVDTGIFSLIIVTYRKMFPVIISANFLFSTSTNREILNGLRKIKVSDEISIALVTMFRFIPTIKKNFIMINQGLKSRGIYFNLIDILKNPIRYYEYTIIPLLIFCNNDVENLTIASLTKSISIDKKHSEYNVKKINIYDWSLLLWMFVMVVLMQLR